MTDLIALLAMSAFFVALAWLSFWLMKFILARLNEVIFGAMDGFRMARVGRWAHLWGWYLIPSLFSVAMLLLGGAAFLVFADLASHSGVVRMGHVFAYAAFVAGAYIAISTANGTVFGIRAIRSGYRGTPVSPQT